jgi:hypothetical protein
MTRDSVAQRDFVLRPPSDRRPVGLHRHQEVADGGDLLDQVLAGRIVPAVNRVGVVRHGASCRFDSEQDRAYIVLAMPVLRFIEPCLPSPADRPPSGSNWIHEIKHDGYRLMARGEVVCCDERGLTRFDILRRLWS